MAVMTPIWKPVYADFGAVSVQEYAVKDAGGTTIYTGKAYKRPDATTMKIAVNDICADYLSQELPEAEGLVTGVPFAAAFSVETIDGTTVALSPTFCLDWSYEDRTAEYAEDEGVVLSDPITNEVDNGHPLLLTVANTDEIEVTFYYRDGTSDTEFFRKASLEHCNLRLDLNTRPGLVRIEVANGPVYTILNAQKMADFNDDFSLDFLNSHLELQSCCRYGLFYVNAFGGWDSLLVKGNTAKTDNYTRYTGKKVVDDVNTQRGELNWCNEVSRALTFNTGWLSDAQCAKMHHLLGSTQVWLYDVLDGTMTPLVLTDTSCEYKTYRGNGAALTQYAINARVAGLEMQRR